MTCKHRWHLGFISLGGEEATYVYKCIRCNYFTNATLKWKP